MEKKLVYRINDNGIGPELLQNVFHERGWTEYDQEEHGDDGWNLWWKTSGFRTSEYTTLMTWQWINHYPNCTSITKKDCLCRNLRKMRVVHGYNVYNFSPLAFNMPNDYTKFVSEYANQPRQTKDKKSNQKMWICKPAESSRGRGIFIFKDLSELQYDCNAVVQQYITDPLLIGGYKFDVRVYVAVASFHPLQIYVHEEGLVRFGTAKYDLGRTDNVFAHLTNTSINKFSPNYTTDKEQVGHGCKWTITQLRRYFAQNDICDKTLWQRVTDIILLTMLMQAPSAPCVRHCFELFGFDILIDNNLKPWLLEVNFSPSLSSDCQADLIAKKTMLHDLLDLIAASNCDQYFDQLPNVHNGRRSEGKRGADSRKQRDGTTISGRNATFSRSDKTNLSRRGTGPAGQQHAQLDTSRFRLNKLQDTASSRSNGDCKSNLDTHLDLYQSRKDDLHNGDCYFGCLKDSPFIHGEDVDYTISVRTDPCVAQVDSKTSLKSDSELLLSEKNDQSKSSSRVGSRSVTPMPLIHPKHSKSEIGVSDPPRTLLGLNLGNSFHNLSKRLSINSSSKSFVRKRPVLKHTDLRSLPGDSNSSHVSDGKVDISSVSKLFRVGLQRNREKPNYRKSTITSAGKQNRVEPVHCDVLRKQVGSFYLIFPFSGSSLNLAHGKLDAKQIIKEIHKQQKIAGDGSHGDDTTDHWGLRIWAPLKKSEGE